MVNILLSRFGRVGHCGLFSSAVILVVCVCQKCSATPHFAGSPLCQVEMNS